MYEIEVYRRDISSLKLIDNKMVKGKFEALEWYKEKGYWKEWNDNGNIVVEVREFPYSNDESYKLEDYDEGDAIPLKTSELKTIGFYEDYNYSLIEKSEYIRVHNDILKIKEKHIFDSHIKLSCVNGDGIFTDISIYDYDNIKHGGILDVIEEGDIVNGCQVLKFQEGQGKNVLVNTYYISENGLWKNYSKVSEDEIQTVLPREKYNQRCLRVGKVEDNEE